jgi:hypothetical protein
MKRCVVVSSSFKGLTPRWASAQDGLVEVTPTIVETRQIATIALIQSNHSNRTQENGVRIFKGPSVSATKNLNGFDRMDEIKREGKE